MTNEEAREILKRVEIAKPIKFEDYADMREALNMAIKALEQQPRPRGKWIHWTDDRKDYVTCSCCEYGEEGEVLLSDKTPYCPNCGSDMGGDKNEME